jgi:hypothetical protein
LVSSVERTHCNESDKAAPAHTHFPAPSSKKGTPCKVQANIESQFRPLSVIACDLTAVTQACLPWDRIAANHSAAFMAFCPDTNATRKLSFAAFHMDRFDSKMPYSYDNRNGEFFNNRVTAQLLLNTSPDTIAACTWVHDDESA